MKYKGRIIVPDGAEKLSPPYSFRLLVYSHDSDLPVELPYSCSFDRVKRLAKKALSDDYTVFGKEIDQIEIAMPMNDLRRRVVAQLVHMEPLLTTPIDVHRNGNRGEYMVVGNGFMYRSDGAGNLTKEA